MVAWRRRWQHKGNGGSVVAVAAAWRHQWKRCGTGLARWWQRRQQLGGSAAAAAVAAAGQRDGGGGGSLAAGRWQRQLGGSGGSLAASPARWRWQQRQRGSVAVAAAGAAWWQQLGGGGGGWRLLQPCTGPSRFRQGATIAVMEMMSLDFVLLGVVKCTDSYAEGSKTTIPPKLKKNLLASSLSRAPTTSQRSFPAIWRETIHRQKNFPPPKTQPFN